MLNVHLQLAGACLVIGLADLALGLYVAAALRFIAVMTDHNNQRKGVERSAPPSPKDRECGPHANDASTSTAPPYRETEANRQQPLA